MRLNEALRLYCRNNKIGVRKLGREIGLDANTVSRFMNGRNVQFDHAAKFIKWLLEDQK